MDWLLFRLSTAAIAAACCFFLGIFSYYQDKSKRINLIFALFNLFLGLWNISDIAIASSPSHDEALFFDRLSYVFATPVIPLFFYLCVEITGTKLKSRLFHFSAVFVCLSIVSTSFTPWLIKDVTISPSLVEVPGSFYICFIIYLVFMLGYGLKLLFSGYKISHGLQKSQLMYTFLALIFAFSAGVSSLSV